MTKRKHFVLFSGGLDSSAMLYNVVDEARKLEQEVEAVGVDYGQRHSKELQAAQQMCNELNIEFSRIAIPKELLAGAMLTSDKAIPNASYAEIPHGMSPTYVPFRNGLMLSLLAAKAQHWVMQNPSGEVLTRSASIYIGSHAEDAENDAYPDCSVEFMQSMGKAIDLGTYGMVSLKRPLILMSKRDVIRFGERAKTPWAKTWSCYQGLDLHCGTCMTCRARKAGFIAAGVDDPTQYAA